LNLNYSANVEWHLYADKSKICAVGKYAEGAAHVICEGIAGSIAFTIGFGPEQRAIGEAAKTQETSNFKNTIGSL
jgi:hypothetical protein